MGVACVDFSSFVIVSCFYVKVGMCDSLHQGFVATRSLAGAGGALGVTLFGVFLQTEFPKDPVLTFDIVAGHRPLPSSGPTAAYNEAMVVADAASWNTNISSAIVRTEALYNHPCREFNETRDYACGPEDRVLCCTIASILSSCSRRTGSSALPALLEAAAPPSRLSNVLALSWHARQGGEIWSSASTVGGGSLSPWDINGAEGGDVLGCAAIVGRSPSQSLAALPAASKGSAFASSMASLDGEFVATLFSEGVAPGGRCSKWVSKICKDFDKLYSKMGFLHRFVNDLYPEGAFKDGYERGLLGSSYKKASGRTRKKKAGPAAAVVNGAAVGLAKQEPVKLV